MNPEEEKQALAMIQALRQRQGSQQGKFFVPGGPNLAPLMPGAMDEIKKKMAYSNQGTGVPFGPGINAQGLEEDLPWNMDSGVY